MDSVAAAAGSDGVWWDAENSKVHKYNNYDDIEATKQYQLAIGENFKNGTIKLDNLSKSQKLTLYALKQQANEGDNTQPKPGMLKIKEGFQHSAWLKLKGVPQEEARKRLIVYLEAVVCWQMCPDEALKAEAKKEVDATAKDF